MQRLYDVTLTLTFERADSIDEGATTEDQAMISRSRLDRYFDESGGVIAYIKTFDANEMVEDLVLEPTQNARWHPDLFQLLFQVRSSGSARDIQNDLARLSLEDSCYEAMYDSGWILFTRNSNNAIYRGQFDFGQVFEYGITDFRESPIVVTRVLF